MNEHAKKYEDKMNEELSSAKELIEGLENNANRLMIELKNLKHKEWYNPEVMKDIHAIAWEIANDSSSLESTRAMAIRYEEYKDEALKREEII